MRFFLVLASILVGVCAFGNLLSGAENLAFGDGAKGQQSIACGALATVAFVALIRKLRGTGT